MKIAKLEARLLQNAESFEDYWDDGTWADTKRREYVIAIEIY